MEYLITSATIVSHDGRHDQELAQLPRHKSHLIQKRMKLIMDKVENQERQENRKGGSQGNEHRRLMISQGRELRKQRPQGTGFTEARQRYNN